MRGEAISDFFSAGVSELRHKELLYVVDVRKREEKKLTSRVQPTGEHRAAGEDMRRCRGRGLSPTSTGSHSRASSCA